MRGQHAGALCLLYAAAGLLIPPVTSALRLGPCVWAQKQRSAAVTPLAALQREGAVEFDGTPICVHAYNPGRAFVVCGRARARICLCELVSPESNTAGDCFYRPHSKVIRDLGVLALRVQGARKREREGEAQGSELTVLDAMCGSGIRALRYLQEGGAGFVLANDANDDLEPERIANLAPHLSSGRVQLSTGDAVDAYFEARRTRAFFDLIDADGFGSGAPHSAEAWWSLRLGGLLYLCSTDARSAAGKNAPVAAWRGFGAVAQSMPASNEISVRLLVADAVRQAAARGMEAEPVFGVFHRQSSCARVMLRLTAAGRRGGSPALQNAVGFAAYCVATGEHWDVPLDLVQDPRAAPNCPRAAQHSALGAMAAADAASHLRMAGPVWVASLHDAAFLREMMEAGTADGDDMSEAISMIAMMLREVEDKLPMMYLRLREVGRFLAQHGCSDLPKKSKLMQELRRRGFRAGDAQAEAQAIKTSAHMADVVSAAKALVEHKKGSTGFGSDR